MPYQSEAKASVIHAATECTESLSRCVGTANCNLVRVCHANAEVYVVWSEFANIYKDMNVSLDPGLNWQGGGEVALLRVYKVDLSSGPQETLKLSIMRPLKPQIFTAVAAKTMAFWNLTPCILVMRIIFSEDHGFCVKYEAVNTVSILYPASTEVLISP